MNNITVVSINDLYALWETRRDYLPRSPERTRKLGGDVGAETGCSTHGQRLVPEVLTTQILPPQRRCMGNGEVGKSSHLKKYSKGGSLRLLARTFYFLVKATLTETP